VHASSTIVPGAFMAVKKSLAVMSFLDAGAVLPPAGALDEQAVTSVVLATATMARAAAAVRRESVHRRGGPRHIRIATAHPG
jgi:hypothetical protein